MEKINVCWKHKRQMRSPDYCMDCGGKPPEKPIAYGDTIKEASIKLSYAFDYPNESVRHARAEYWEDKLRYLIEREDYKIYDTKKGDLK